MPGITFGVARLNDPVDCSTDLHGILQALHVTGTFINGSPNTLVNGLPLIRLTDPGISVACPGPNAFVASSGCIKTFCNGLPVVIDGKTTMHCGNPASIGSVRLGFTSPNVTAEKIV